MNVTQKITDTH